jgi:hypothetical protein
MTTSAGPTYLQTLTDAEAANEVVLWKAAQTVRSRVTDPEDRAELLGALGLSDAQRPAGWS